MGLRINQNIAAMNAYRNLSVTDGQQAKSLEKLASGFRINRAADDAAGLAISEGLRSQIGGLKVAARNSQDAISVIQTAEGALTETHSILQRMRDLTVQASNAGANDTNSQAALQTEANALGKELDRISGKTTFNGVELLDGAYDGTFQVGYASGDTIAVAINADIDNDTTTAGVAFDAKALLVGEDDGAGNTKALDLTAAGTLDAIDNAIKAVSSSRANLGAMQNRFEHVVNSVNISIENLSASESRIRDTDMAQEMTSFTRSQILTQAGTAMLAQANSAPQGVLSLLRG
jgi:flagellin